MRNILSPENREVLVQFAFSNALVAFDYDGTLAPIVADPERAWMRPRTRKLLEELARVYPCIVISGRGQADTRSRLQGIGVRGVIGNHGAEARLALNGFTHEVSRWRKLLEARLSGEQGITIEDKAHSIAIHYRRARQKRKAREAALEAAASLGKVRVLGGKQVVNLLPLGAPHKGDALERERGRLECDTAIYVGDDDTDEDVFRLDQPGRLLTIRVGAKQSSQAAYCIRDQRQVDALIGELWALRAPR
jgi:trehalose 6-phosphate phosphatase